MEYPKFIKEDGIIYLKRIKSEPVTISDWNRINLTEKQNKLFLKRYIAIEK